MAVLILSVVLGVVFSVFATQNTGPVTLNIGKLVFYDIPVYLAVLIPLITGLVLSLVFQIARDVSLKLTISEQEDKIDNLKRELAETVKNAHKLQLENSRLKTQTGKPKDENAL